MIQDEIRLFGRLHISCEGVPLSAPLPQKASELLAYLLLFPSVPHYRGHIAALLWDHASDAQARSYLRKALWQLQSALPICEQLLSVEPDWIGVRDASCVWVDTLAFQSAYDSTVGISSASLDDEDLATMGRATEMYRGELLEGCDRDWCFLERDRLASMNQIMLDKMVEFCLARGQFEQGLVLAHRLLRWDQAHERTHRHLMILYSLVDNRTAALRQYQRCQDILCEELGVEPAQETEALYEAICADQSVAQRLGGAAPSVAAGWAADGMKRLLSLFEGPQAPLNGRGHRIDRAQSA